MKKPNSVIIRGRRWFQKSYGNTYNTVSIEIDGREVTNLPMEYGYGDYYLQRAGDWLEANGYMPNRKHYPNGVAEPVWSYFQDRGISCEYDVIDVKHKRDL